MSTFDTAFAMISENADKIDFSQARRNAEVEMELTGSGGGIMSASLHNGSVTVRRGEAARPDCIIILSAGDFERLMNGSLSPMAALFSGRIKVEGDMSVLIYVQELLFS